MAKEISALIKLQIRGGAANPAPPVGPALGAKGVNIMDFCKQFNARTQENPGKVLPVVITVFADKSFEFVVKKSPVAVSVKEAIKLKSGSAESNRVKVGRLLLIRSKLSLKKKMPDMNCFTVESAMHMIAGTARSMGVTVNGKLPEKV